MSEITMVAKDIQEKYNSEMDVLETKNGEAKKLVDNRYTEKRGKSHADSLEMLYAGGRCLKEAGIDVVGVVYYAVHTLYKTGEAGARAVYSGLMAGHASVATRMDAYDEKTALDEQLKSDKVNVTLEFAAEAQAEIDKINMDELAPINIEVAELEEKIRAAKAKAHEPIGRIVDLRGAKHDLNEQAAELNKAWYNPF